MITTLCLNPSFDRTVTVDSLFPGRVHRLRGVRVDPGGKGLNVAAVCRTLGEPARCLCAAGQDNADRLEALLRCHGQAGTVTVPVPGAVRTNIKIMSLSGQPMTELNEPGPSLGAPELAEITRQLLLLAEESSLVVLTGSLPAGCPASLYADLIRAIGPEKCVLDASGDALREGLRAGPLLAKPNLDELAEIAGGPVSGLGGTLRAARTLLAGRRGALLVSMGGDGALLVTRDRVWAADALPVKVQSTVGAGDAMLAAALCGMDPADWPAALRRGIAAGAASVMTEGTGLVEAETYRRLLPWVKIREIDSAAAQTAGHDGWRD